MPFEKGNKLSNGRQLGCRSMKTRQWDSIGDYLVQHGAEHFLLHLQKLAKKNPEKYCDRFMQILEYFKPKMARIEKKTEVTITDNRVMYLPDRDTKRIDTTDESEIIDAETN